MNESDDIDDTLDTLEHSDASDDTPEQEEPHATTILSGGRTSSNLFFVDLETTNLDFTNNLILEIGAVVTDKYLNELDSFEAVIHYEPEELKRMSDWTKKQFAGDLMQKVSTSELSWETVKNQFIDFLDKYREGKKVILAGSSVTFDRYCLQYAMPKEVSERLHYRVVDVSSVMELVKRWNTPVYHRSTHKPTVHRALSDARESLNVLRYYKNFAFQAASPGGSRDYHCSAVFYSQGIYTPSTLGFSQHYFGNNGSF